MVTWVALDKQIQLENVIDLLIERWGRRKKGLVVVVANENDDQEVRCVFVYFILEIEI